MKKLLLFVSSVSLGFVSFSANRIVDISDSEKIQIFDEPGSYTWVAPNSLVGPARLLVVGGGGGGGGNSGGGGGGGQVVYVSSVTLSAGTAYRCIVGEGGRLGDNANGTNGETSRFCDDDIVDFAAVGGGFGAGGWTGKNGGDGANGGGATGQNNVGYDGGKPTVPDGFPGGSKIAGAGYRGCGGGGAGGKGLDSSASRPDGGPGVTNSITGVDVVYGYGGGGGGLNNQGLGGAMTGYGDAGGPARQGEPGTGGGGGGGAYGSNLGGNGGCGAVVIRYTIDTHKDDFSADITRSIKVPTTVTFTAELGTELSQMAWNFGDGSSEVVTTELSVSHTYTSPGRYTVTMTHGTQVIAKASFVEIISGTLYVDAASQNPMPPYDTRETAATKVTDAMAYAENGFEVRIAPGDYPLDEGSYVNVTNGVSVVGEGSSPADVVLRSTHRRSWFNDKVMRINNAKAIVVNVTLADGSVSNGGWGGCLLIDSLGGTVSNCVIRNGWASIPVQALAGGAYLNAGLVTHSVFEDCKYSGVQLGNSPMASAARLNGPASIENCLFRGCTGEVGVVVAVMNTRASVVNCTIVDSQIGFWTGNNNVTNDGSAICCTAGSVKNCAVCNVKRLAYNDRPETYDAAFGTDLSKFTACAKTEMSDYRNYAGGDYRPAPGGVLVNAGAEVQGWTKDSPMTDLARRPRVQGRVIDIGCYESSAGGLVISVR